LRNLTEKGEVVVPTLDKIFKFDISCENIQRMISHMIDKQYDAKRVHTKTTRSRSK